MDYQRIEELLERIAVALERLAASCDACANANARQKTQVEVKEARVNTSAASDPARLAGSVLQSFLASRGIQIKVIPPDDPADHVIDSLSLFLGERYEALSGLLAKIKRAMQSGMPITESLKNRSQQDISSICQFCTRLHEVAFLEQYQYFRSPVYLIKAKTTSHPKAQRFFGGQWLERFILQKVKAIHAQISAEVSSQLDFDYLINPQIILPNGDDFELDILTRFGPWVYWIEAKSGDYQQYVAKYSKVARILSLDYAHSFMVLTDVPNERCESLSCLFSMSVCNLRSFEERLLAVARNDTAQHSTAANGVPPVAER